MKDPYVAEVRKYRLQHTKQFGSNLHLICEDLRQLVFSPATSPCMTAAAMDVRLGMLWPRCRTMAMISRCWIHSPP